jgi:hypothetical protein
VTGPPREFLRLAPTALVVWACAVLLLGPVLIHPTTLALGSTRAEAPVHLWGLWTVADGLFRHGPFVRVADIDWPQGFAAHLMDPVNLLVFLPTFWLAGGGVAGAVAGWNALHLVTIVVGAIGMVLLGRRWLDASDAWPIALMVLVFCGSPFLLATPAMGRSEYLPAALYPLHLALLHPWLRRLPGGATRSSASPPPLWTGLLAGLTLGGIFLGGWYLSVFVGILEVVIGLWWTSDLTRREAAWRLALVAGVGTVCLVPAAIAVATWPSARAIEVSQAWASEHWGQEQYPATSLIDLFRLSFRRADLTWPDQPAYVGALPLILGLVGIGRRRPGALPWLLLTLLTLAFAAGPWILPGRPPTPSCDHGACLKGPAWWLMRGVPPLRSITMWSRMGGVAALPAALAAGIGFASLLHARTGSEASPSLPARIALWLAPLVLLLALADQVTWPRRLVWPPPTFDPAIPGPVADAIGHLSPGAILVLPLDNRPDAPKNVIGLPDRFLLWQLQHRRPISAPESSEGIAPLVRISPLVRAVHELGQGRDGRRRTVPGPRLVTCAHSWAAQLHDVGLAGILLVPNDSPEERVQPFLSELLGPPTFDQAGVAAWDLALLLPRAGAFQPDPACSEPSPTRAGAARDRHGR